MTLQGTELLPSASTAHQREDAASPAMDGRVGFPQSRGRQALSLARTPKVQKLLRYTFTSGVSTAISEVTLLVLYSSGLLGATGASVIANLAGAVPSYLLSRYWIWPEADRSGAARQVGLYWATSLVSLVVSTAGTSLAAAHSPTGHLAHVVVVGAAYVGTYALLWMAKFIVYQRVVFSRPREVQSGEAA